MTTASWSGITSANWCIFSDTPRGEAFSDDVVAAAMIDRLVHHAEVIALSGESYRTRARRELLAKNGNK